MGFHMRMRGTYLAFDFERVCEGGKDFNSSMCNSKIIGARCFSEGLKANTNLSKVSARDDVGHGTQVASIAASKKKSIKLTFALKHLFSHAFLILHPFGLDLPCALRVCPCR